MSEKTDRIAIVTTFDSEARALACARALVEERLAACAQIDAPIRSIYRWQGALCDEREVRLVLKSRRDLFDRACARIAQLHPYDCPQIVAFDIAAGHPPYLEWMGEGLEPGRDT